MRKKAWETIQQQTDVDVLIIGGGVNGIGTLRDLAVNGVNVLLVEKSDFCSGASAASSHMMHGGLRYLENGEFRLVREALHERDRLLVNAPHYVHPLPTTIPIFSWLSGMFNAPLKFLGLLNRPAERGAYIIKMGLMMYDWFTRESRVMPTHHLTGRLESLRQRPGINRDIVCTATYYDGYLPYPERLCMEMVADAQATGNAQAINYVSAVAGEGAYVTLRDELTSETTTIRPKVVINAAGPWIDFVNDAIGQPTRFIGGTKGAHLVLDHPELHEACAGHELFFENKDGRITLFFPLEDRVLAGTTDIPVDNPDQVKVTDEEIDYILSAIKLVFPQMQVSREHIVFWFTGVRPLPSSDAATAGQISRDHSIQMVEPGETLSFPILSLVGGKWTTFRAFSEQTADEVLRRLGRSRKVSTKKRAIGGGRDYPHGPEAQAAWLDALHAQTAVPLARLAQLFQRYGTYAAEVAGYIAAGEDAPLAYVDGYSQREIAFIVTQEQVSRLDDLLLRRSLLAMLGKVNGAAVAELGACVGAALGWPEEQTRAEISRAESLLATKHGMRL